MDYQTRVFSMAKDQIGTAIAVGNGYAIPQLIEIAASHPSSFEEAQTKVVADTKAEKSQQLANENASKVQEQIKAGKSDLASLAKIAGEDIKTTGQIARGGSIQEFGSLSDQDDEIFGLSVGKVGKPVTLSGKTLVFAVKARHDIKQDEMTKAMTSLRTDVLNAKRNRYFSEYIKDAQKRMEDNRE